MPPAKPKLPAICNENDILRRIVRAFSARRQPHIPPHILVGMGDDAALLEIPSASTIAISSDAFLEGVHFLPRLHSPESVGYKCLARAVSDLAAMGARPHSFLLALALPPEFTGKWLRKFLAGLRRSADTFQIALIGGDTSRYPSIMVQVTVVGVVSRPIASRPAHARKIASRQIRSPGLGILRSGARPGDSIFVTGRLGAAELGLHLIPNWPGRPLTKPTERHPLLSAHMFPRPPVELAVRLAAAGIPSAMMDISDGLSTDLTRLCKASRVGARVEIARLPTVRIPRIPQAQERDPIELALHGGEDYGLLFTVPTERLARLARLAQQLRPSPSNRARHLKSHSGGSTPWEKITCIGETNRGGKIETVDADGHTQPLLPGGWDPFVTACPPARK